MHLRIRSALSCLALLSLTACSGASDDTSAGDTDTTTGGDTTTTGGEGPALGERSSQACKDAIAAFASFASAADAAGASAAYTGTALQTYVQANDTLGERSDDAAIVAALAEGTPEGLAHAWAQAQASMILRLRKDVGAPELLVEDPYAAWDEAHCLWEGSIGALMQEAEAAGDASDGDIFDIIDAAIIDGHAGIFGVPPAASIDEWIVPPSKQRIEKTIFRGLHRLVLKGASDALAGDAAAARRAIGLFAALEDRLDGRNTPGIAIIAGMLAEPATIDLEVIEREMNVAFAKRTRKYCSDALDSDALGVPSGYKGAVEGLVYQALIMPDMSEKLAADGFVAGDYQATWEAWVEAVKAGDDPAGAMELSATLVEWNCAYQAKLGIAACTESEDEPTP